MRDPIRSVFSETIERSLCPVSFCLTLFMYRNYPKFQGEVGAHQSTPRRNYNSKSQMRKFRRVRDEELAGGRSAHSVLTQNEYKVGSLFRSSGSKVQRKKVHGFRRLLCTRHTGRDSTQTTTNSMSILKNGDRTRGGRYASFFVKNKLQRTFLKCRTLGETRSEGILQD